MLIHSTPISVSAIIPVRDEAQCIAGVVQAFLALKTSTGEPLLTEVIVADNGSSDGSGAIARAAGARVLVVPKVGYGQACFEAGKVANGNVLLYIDGDGACDPKDTYALIDLIADGADLAIGVRDKASPGAMTSPQRFGNGLACMLLRLIWGVPTPDLGPFRAIRRSAYDAVAMQDRSYGWTVEMQIRAQQIGLRVAQCSVAWHVRVAGHSKVSGTVRGVIGAGIGILGMISTLWVAQMRRPLQQKQPFHSTNRPKENFYV